MDSSTELLVYLFAGEGSEEQVEVESKARDK
jgi:hypothetical protein